MLPWPICMSHTLAQNCHCEFCCGIHETCKNTSVKPDRNGSVKGPEKHWEAAIAIASVVAKLKQAEKSPKKRRAGSWLSRLPCTTKNVSRKWAWSSRCVTKASLRHITMERQCLRWWMTARPCIHPCFFWKNPETAASTKPQVRSFTSLQMVHTHTIIATKGKAVASRHESARLRSLLS